jgi:FixJ family two-component response regulator
VIVTSGFNEQEVSSRFAGKGLAAFLEKPFRVKGLGQVLREALGG